MAKGALRIEQPHENERTIGGMNEPDSHPLDAASVTNASSAAAAIPEYRRAFPKVDGFLLHGNRYHRLMNVSLTS